MKRLSVRSFPPLPFKMLYNHNGIICLQLKPAESPVPVQLQVGNAVCHKNNKTEWSIITQGITVNGHKTLKKDQSIMEHVEESTVHMNRVL